MSSIDVRVTNSGTAADGDPEALPAGQLIYDYNPRVTEMVEYGCSAGDLLSGQTRPPAEGARFDLYLEGPVSGPKLNGTLRGVDYLTLRADGRAELHIHAEITTDDGKKIALLAGGVATPEERALVYQLREYVTLTSNHPELRWVNSVHIWASGSVDISTGQVRVRGYAV
jgi:hypothetical protein